MPRFKLTIEYAGTRYSGWQIQKNARTVQGELARAIEEATHRKEFELYGAGRTDAGVHALAQVAHLEIYSSLPPRTLRDRINELLPADIHVNAIVPVPHRFHARHDARSRSYLYQISRRKTAFFKPYVWWVKEPLDVDAMRAASASFVGMKSFDAFTADEPEEKSTKVLVDRVEVAEDGALVLIRVVGSHFLWRMVRRMTGVLAAVGRRELRSDDIGRLLDSQSGIPATLTAPASGLFLEGVYYREGDGPGPLVPPIRVTR
ncbi:MAG TPA: tRNA pseudouridine(38-40) synthase TruA [Vicinamibacterales bacterium]|jgi:tRNA pseudouridine38-40 synthase|nr:tRNA pseudouridine(38-40) synthase TruA [Vicinamibacterales bacterium]